MKTFTITREYTTIGQLFIEAANIDDAFAIADEVDLEQARELEACGMADLTESAITTGEEG